MKLKYLSHCLMACGIVFYGVMGYAGCEKQYNLCAKSCNRYLNRCKDQGSRTKPPEHCGGQYEQCLQGCSDAQSNCPLPEK